MTKEKLAALLDGREYGNEITKDEEIAAKSAGLVVIFGYSDDNAELRGAIHDEVSCYDGESFRIHKYGVLVDWENVESEEHAEEYFKYKRRSAEVAVFWGEEGYSWTYEADIPCATFEIVEDGEKYCRGIVIDLADIKAEAAA